MSGKVLFPPPLPARGKNNPPGKLDLSSYGVRGDPITSFVSKQGRTKSDSNEAKSWSALAASGIRTSCQLVAILFEACPMRDSRAGKASPLLFTPQGGRLCFHSSSVALKCAPPNVLDVWPDVQAERVRLLNL